MRPFTHETPAQRVSFGSGLGAQHLAAEVAQLDAARVLVIASDDGTTATDRITAGLPVAGRVTEVVPHVPVATAERARAAAAAVEADLLVPVGGGSAIGLAKAVALTSGLPIVAVPTTYAGSEATSVWGLTEGRRKTTGTDPRVLPVAVVYDAELTLSLPGDLTTASGINALAHAADTLWGPAADPISTAWAGEGARALVGSLRALAVRPGDLAAREEAQYGCYLAAVAFASAGAGLHHKLCHVLGGMFDLPHAATHAVVLPHVLAFNADAAPGAMARLGAAIGVADAVAGTRELLDELDAPRSLRELGVPGAALAEVAEVALPLVPATNPRPVDLAALTGLLQAAWSGR